MIAVEAYEGTDEMIRRAGSFNTEDLLFVKTVKTRQDWRFDVPCFGLRTLEAMREAKVGAAALEAGKVLVLDVETGRFEAYDAAVEAAHADAALAGAGLMQ